MVNLVVCPEFEQFHELFILAIFICEYKENVKYGQI
jgi:hypothetical protein